MLSGDSTVAAFSFNGRRVSFLYEDDESDATYRVEVETTIIYSETGGGQGCVHMRLEPSEGTLEIDAKSKRFILPGSFAKQMAAINKGYHVLAGLDSTQYTMLFILQGQEKIIVCPVKGEQSISIEKCT